MVSPHSWMLFVALHELFHGGLFGYPIKMSPQLQIYPLCMSISMDPGHLPSSKP